jgi:hypothetical protein
MDSLSLLYSKLEITDLKTLEIILTAFLLDKYRPSEHFYKIYLR